MFKATHKYELMVGCLVLLFSKNAKQDYHYYMVRHFIVEALNIAREPSDVFYILPTQLHQVCNELMYEKKPCTIAPDVIREFRIKFEEHHQLLKEVILLKILED